MDYMINWKPEYNLHNIFKVYLPLLLQHPVPLDPLNHEATALYLNDTTAYNGKVRGKACCHQFQRQEISDIVYIMQNWSSNTQKQASHVAESLKRRLNQRILSLLGVFQTFFNWSQ